MNKKKVWVDARPIGMTIDLPNEELREISKGMWIPFKYKFYDIITMKNFTYL
jgi:hypothetical protein